ncbi:MAG: hypothetical protein KFF73_11615, partial [Cyclobacteriaceae bacterium]|nr:hypothetical protein [Cyclobacteriaceae bacterium]
ELSGFDMYSFHPGEKYEKLSRDVVASNDFHAWEFKIDKYGSPDHVTISWENENFGDSDYNLILLDESGGRLIDMSTTRSYTFMAAGHSKFRIYYGKDEKLVQEIIPNKIQIGEIYPNPFQRQVIIPVAIPDGNEIYQVKIILTDLTGKIIHELPTEQLIAGFHEINCIIGNDHGNGVNILQIIISSAKQKEVFYRKVLNFR